MPTYQYRCTSCSEIVERKQSFNDAPLTVCPSCNGELRRVLSPAQIIFSGSGWYCKDSHQTDNKQKAAACDSCEKSDTAACSKEA